MLRREKVTRFLFTFSYIFQSNGTKNRSGFCPCNEFYAIRTRLRWLRNTSKKPRSTPQRDFLCFAKLMSLSFAWMNIEARDERGNEAIVALLKESKVSMLLSPICTEILTWILEVLVARERLTAEKLSP